MRPDMTRWFQGRIDWHVNGIGSTSTPLPKDVTNVQGDVTDTLIVVTDAKGNEWRWIGGRYAAKKVRGCFAPLMPKPVPSATRSLT